MGLIDGGTGIGSYGFTRVYRLPAEGVQSREYKILDGGQRFAKIGTVADTTKSLRDIRVRPCVNVDFEN